MSGQEHQIDGLSVVRAPETDQNPVVEPYDYFAFGGRERMDALSKEVERLERDLFALDMHEEILDGSPDTLNRMPHASFVVLMKQQEKDAEAAGKAYVQQGICPCIDCELARVRSSQQGLRHGLYRLRALSSTISGKKG